MFCFHVTNNVAWICMCRGSGPVRAHVIVFVALLRNC